MNTYLIDEESDRTLRSFDPAPATTRADLQRKEDLFAMITATDPAHRSANDHVPVPLRRRKRPVTRWASLGLAAAGLTAIALVVPGLGNPDQAYAAWSASPTTVDPATAAAVTQACQEMTSSAVTDLTTDFPDADSSQVTAPTAAFAPVATERRGDVVSVVLATPEGSGPPWIVQCLAVVPDGSTEVPSLLTMVQAHSTNTRLGGSDLAPAVTGSLIDDGPGGAEKRIPYSTIDTGLVGADVAEVTIHTGTETVQATVSGGRYTAWWPISRVVPSFDPSDEAAARQAMESMDPEENVTYDVTLKDGTVLTNVALADAGPGVGMSAVTAPGVP
ncbi:MAG: hypothetical protein KBB39_14490 [Phycicoccus sp.]|nr:hypothetical protein [Phycicoccus sp.]